jgi:hypothetical protein
MYKVLYVKMMLRLLYLLCATYLGNLVPSETFVLIYVLVSNAKFSYLRPFSLIRIMQIPNIHALFLGSWKLACAVVNMCK